MVQGNNSNNIPDWVNPDYGYDPNNPRNPNAREVAEALGGKPLEEMTSEERASFSSQASELLYGVVGSNTDTRDWNAIFESAKAEPVAPDPDEPPSVGPLPDWITPPPKGAIVTQAAVTLVNPITGEKHMVPTGGYKVNVSVSVSDYDANKLTDAAQIATSQMYGGTTVSYQAGEYQKDEEGNTVIDANGKPVESPPNLYIVGGNGSVLRNLSGNADQMANTLKSFGVQDTSWVNSVSAAMDSRALQTGENVNPNIKQAFDTLQKTYNPFQNEFVNNLSNTSKPLTTGVTQNTSFQIIEGGNVVGTGTPQIIGSSPDSGTGADTGTMQPIQDSNQFQLPQGYQDSSFTSSSMAPITGTFTKDATGILSNQTGQTYMIGNNLQQQTANTTGAPQYDVRMYRNNAGMTTSITFINGKAQTPIPSGFYPVNQQPAGQMPFQSQVPTTPAPTVTPVQGYNPVINNPVTMQPFTPQFNMAQGGIVPELPKPSGKKFGGFKPEAKQRIAQSLGYTGDMEEFDKFLNENPEKKEQMNKYTESAKQMAEGGYVQRFSNGGQPESTTIPLQQYDPRVLNQQYIPQQQTYTGNLVDVQEELAKTPALPLGATVVPVGTQVTADQLVSPYSGQVSGSVAIPTALATTDQAMMPIAGQTALMSPIEASGAVTAAADQTQAAQIEQIASITAAQQEGTSVANVEAAQGTAILMDNPVQRQVEQGELVSGVANAETAAAFNEQIEAATATPTKQATVQGQLETLMSQFEGGNTPSWAAGAMRTATATMAARGLGASSLAGQAIVQAAMEAALPIAQMDAQVTAQFEQQNLSNRQQRAILAAQQRAQFLGMEFDQGFQARVANAAKISDIANMNFTAEQQVALENSRIANTMELTNLSNSQAMILAEASALANMDMANLNNRQQAAVQNAQNFLQADLTNLSNQQQVELFKAQQRVQSLFTDQAALNAAQQFNATSQNQTDQFFAQLQTNTAQFNASQANAQAQFNAGQVNVIERFNAEINNQRDQFNANNRLVIDQANAQWRRQIATADTAAVNRANEINAQALLGYSQAAYNNLWQFYADNMEWAWTSAENERGRISAQAIAQLQADTSMSIAEFKADAESSAGIGSFIGDLFTSDLTGTLTGTIAEGLFPGFFG